MTEPTQAMPAEEPRRVGGRYLLRSLLGRGGSAEVWRAEDTLLGRSVALKLVTAPHAPVPFSPALEDIYIPSVAKIEAAVRQVMSYGARQAAE